MNSSSDQDSHITTVYDIDVENKRCRSNRILGKPPSYDEEQLHHNSSSSHTATSLRTPVQGFVSPQGGHPNGAAYPQPHLFPNQDPPLPHANHVAAPLSVNQHHPIQDHHPAAAARPVGPRQQLPIQEIRVQQGYQQHPQNLPHQILALIQSLCILSSIIQCTIQPSQ